MKPKLRTSPKSKMDRTVPQRPRARGIRIAKWGNCMAVRIPKRQAEQTGLTLGDEVMLEKVADGVLIKPMRKRPTLKELVAGITAENLHGEVDTGAPIGRELF